MQLLLPEVAPHHRLAVPVDAISEVLTVQTDHSAFPSLQVALVYKIPCLHNPRSNTHAPFQAKVVWQRVSSSGSVVRGTANIIKQHLVSSQ